MHSFLYMIEEKAKCMNIACKTHMSVDRMHENHAYGSFSKIYNILVRLAYRNKTNIVSGPASLQNIPVMYAFFTPVLNV